MLLKTCHKISLTVIILLLFWICFVFGRIELQFGCLYVIETFLFYYKSYNAFQ